MLWRRGKHIWWCELCSFESRTFEAHRLRHGESIALELPLKWLLRLRRRAIRGAIDCDIVFGSRWISEGGCDEARQRAQARLHFAHATGTSLRGNQRAQSIFRKSASFFLEKHHYSRNESLVPAVVQRITAYQTGEHKTAVPTLFVRLDRHKKHPRRCRVKSSMAALIFVTSTGLTGARLPQIPPCSYNFSKKRPLLAI